MQKKSTVDQLSLGKFRVFFDKGECPICQSTAEHLQRFYFWFVTKSYYNPALMDQLKDSYGFCKEHTWKLIEAGRSYLTEVMYGYLVRNTKSNLEQLLKKIQPSEVKKASLLRRKLGRKDFRKIMEILTIWSHCPPCESLEWNAKCAMKEFLEVLNGKDMKELYKKSGGLCVLHLLEVLSISEEAEATYLIEGKIERTKRLDEEVCEFLRRFGYRYENEPKGQEQDSWIRATRFFVGKRFDSLALIKRLEEGHLLKATASKGGVRCC